MRLTAVLSQQHIGRMFRSIWVVKNKRHIIETPAHRVLERKGVKIVDALEYCKKEKKNMERLTIIGAYEKRIPIDKYHPDWKETSCYILKANEVLLKGLQQAQILTKTVHVSDTLPDYIHKLANVNIPLGVHEQVKKAIMHAFVFDTEQQKLPRPKHPTRPMFVFPLPYGITDVRQVKTITNKLLTILERNSNNIASERFAIDSADASTSFIKESDYIQLQTKSELLLSSLKPLPSVSSETDFTNGIELPNLYPIKHTVTLNKEHFYDFNSKYPIKDKTVKKFHPHTTILKFCKSEVKNLYATPVTENQLQGRSLLHSFSIASSYAKAMYGDDVLDLPKPVTIQCVHTNGCTYDLSIFQLNTLNVDGTDGIKNEWYSSPRMKLFEMCQYLNGRPVLEGYNPRVYEYLSAFYNNR